jgi:hypothetical protein
MHGSCQLRSASERRAEFVEPIDYEAKVDGYDVVGAKGESAS